MILADKFDNYNTVILQITIHISTNFILIMIDQPERDGIMLIQSGIVIIESIGESHFHICDCQIRIANRHLVRISQLIIVFRHQCQARTIQ